jgi:hypothetical protein
MINRLVALPKEVWITFPLFRETVIRKVTAFEATYDEFGYKEIRYRTRCSVDSWDRDRHEVIDIFETKQEAINSVADGNYILGEK